jgi:pimeloyl-ACP methyl ester carboxylesterase
VTPQVFRYNEAIDIHYRVSGSGPRQLLMLHGFGASWESWERIRPLLEDRYTLILADLKGFGLSSKPLDARYSAEDQTEVVLAFIRAMGFDNLTLAGHSFGGMVSAMAALKLESLRSLILIAAPAYRQHFPFFISMLRRPVINEVFLNRTTARFRARYTLRRIVCDRKSVTPEQVDRYARYLDLPGAHHALICTAKQILPVNVDSFPFALRTLLVPTLIIWGREDRVTPLWSGQRLNGDIPGSRLVVLDRCAHMPQEEWPRETAELIREFLS